jgi:hypothetical protein
MAPLTAWFSTYLDGATVVLSRSPTASLDSPDLLTLPIAKMGSCSSCRLDGFSGLIKFLDVLRAKIDKDIGSVSIILDHIQKLKAL